MTEKNKLEKWAAWCWRTEKILDTGEDAAHTYKPGFWVWLSCNGHIFAAYRDLALETKRAGHERWSSRALIHVLRWQTAVREEGQTILKINSSASASLARLCMEVYPELDGFFSLRRPPDAEKAWPKAVPDDD